MVTFLMATMRCLRSISMTRSMRRKGIAMGQEGHDFVDVHRLRMRRRGGGLFDRVGGWGLSVGHGKDEYKLGAREWTQGRPVGVDFFDHAGSCVLGALRGC